MMDGHFILQIAPIFALLIVLLILFRGELAGFFGKDAGGRSAKRKRAGKGAAAEYQPPRFRVTFRGKAVLTVGAVSVLCALSFGGRLYSCLAILTAVLFVYAFVSCLWTKRTLCFTQQLTSHKTFRGENGALRITQQHFCPLPVSPVTLNCLCAGYAEEYELPGIPFREYTASHSLRAAHVGLYGTGIRWAEISDLFGLLCVRKKPSSGLMPLAVLPNPFPIDKPRTTVGDDGASALGRTQEDYNAPEDVRAYRPGDAMKRIHWKLSSRKRELLVRRFEMPAPPDTLILLDCAPPVGGESVTEGGERLRDALCETAVAVAKLQMGDASPVRLPLYGANATEFTSDQASGLALLQEMLASQPFTGGEDFARVLNLELRRMRRTGAAVIITTRLNAQIVEGVSHIRRMGPTARLYLVTFTPDAPEYQPYVTRLQHHLVEVCYVTPA